MHKNRFSFISELERDTANIDDIRIAGQKLAAVYSNEEDLVWSDLLQFSNSVRLCVYEKQESQSHETLMHRLIGKITGTTFSKRCYYSAFVSLFNVLKLHWWKAILETERDKE